MDIGEVWELHTARRDRSERREIRILNAAREAAGVWNVLFIHADADSDADAARRERIDPAARRIAEELSGAGHAVAVVPVRETEAWVLADGDALRAAFGTRKDNAGLGIPRRPRDVERLPDPKQCLNHAFRSARGAGPASREPAAARLPLLGERIDLRVLEAVPAFAQLRTELTTALRSLGYIGVA